MDQAIEPIITFEKIIGNDEQITILYRLLQSREYNISHNSLPSFEEHKEFTLNHPYRIWYLLKLEDKVIGTAYILPTNCIGINLIKNLENLVPKVLSFVCNKHRPLDEIKSVRPPNFYINVNPNNFNLIANLEKIGAKQIQLTYSLH